MKIFPLEQHSKKQGMDYGVPITRFSLKYIEQKYYYTFYIILMSIYILESTVNKLVFTAARRRTAFNLTVLIYYPPIFSASISPTTTQFRTDSTRFYPLKLSGYNYA